MYVGRIVAIGKNKNDQIVVMYRVSSRSFQKREAVKISDNSIAIVPKKGHEEDINRNPYIAYNSLKISGNYIAAANGTHTDFILEKLEKGNDIRDALALVLLGMDYEHDDFATPRIAACADTSKKAGGLGIITEKGLLVNTFDLAKGQARYIATYEHNYFSDEFLDTSFDAEDASAACTYVIEKGIFKDLTLPVTSACAVEKPDGIEIDFLNL